MSMGNENGSRTDGNAGTEIYHRKVTPDVEEATRSLLRLVANLENCEVTDLPPLYDCIDHMVEHLFDSPPSPEAQTELEFSYFGYRIRIDQSGNVSLKKLADIERDGD
ncbi:MULTISPECIES: HalOD1 output domain-containing protein [Halorussus]|uniref:HalOD1 output domain-containing protein n=1 Tax=Halorussus TaxID=1070314 RepID=UPI0019630548|nr:MULTISPECIES: HalOD1 output domain-containing protein [Halorussus]